LSETIKAWHFLPADRRLAYDDKRLVRKGTKLTVPPPVKMCTRGLHASIRPIDALSFQRGPIICRVVVGGEIEHGDDKIVGTERTVLWWADATNTLHEFACWCAEKALKNANVTDERCYAAIATKLRWLKGEATDAELDAAESAARSAARSAAWSAARSAAWRAAESAARSAAWRAAESAQNDKLTSMLNKLAN
jgi:hypothetical protein